MKLLKKINNNFALALDSTGTTIIVEGRGVGFQKMPCELKDLSIISKTYYDAKEQDVALIKSVPENILEVASEVADLANKTLPLELNGNLTFILADHIQFSLERIEENLNVAIPLYYDIERLYPKESKIADYAVHLIRRKLREDFPEEEKTGIALNIINSEKRTDQNRLDSNRLIELCTSIVEKMMGIKIKRDSFNYSRFVSHIQYVIQKNEENYSALSENAGLYASVSKDYPKAKECVDKIAEELRKLGFRLNNEEKLYLMLHVNRLCSREDCNR